MKYEESPISLSSDRFKPDAEIDFSCRLFIDESRHAEIIIDRKNATAAIAMSNNKRLCRESSFMLARTLNQRSASPFMTPGRSTAMIIAVNRTNDRDRIFGI